MCKLIKILENILNLFKKTKLVIMASKIIEKYEIQKYHIDAFLIILLYLPVIFLLSSHLYIFFSRMLFKIPCMIAKLYPLILSIRKFKHSILLMWTTKRERKILSFIKKKTALCYNLLLQRSLKIRLISRLYEKFQNENHIIEPWPNLNEKKKVFIVEIFFF